jgi:hypothetical protein
MSAELTHFKSIQVSFPLLHFGTWALGAAIPAIALTLSKFLPLFQLPTMSLSSSYFFVFLFCLVLVLGVSSSKLSSLGHKNYFPLYV